MFEPSDAPRILALPPGVDFPRALVHGLLNRCADLPSEALARVSLVVNTQRMARRITALFNESGPRLLPRISLITDVSGLPGSVPLAPAGSPLRRQFLLTRLIEALLEREPDLAGREAAFDLAGSLAALIDEMHGEGVAPDVLKELDVGHLSAHWARAKAFVEIADTYLRKVESTPDSEARHRIMVRRLIEAWEAAPPRDPVIVAGSTGSRGTTAMLLRAVARLPQGAVVLPGFDFQASAEVWEQLSDPLHGEDHPQFRFARLLGGAGLRPGDVANWAPDFEDVADRNKILSLALRPAPYTDAWLREGARLPDPVSAFKTVTLVEADSAREEAVAIALRLRQAVEEDRTAALISPDRVLTRQVAAALDRWGIVADDSAGQPLHLSPPGRFLRQVAGLFAAPLRSDGLMALLKHPLAHSGSDRGEHLRLTRDLELFVRDKGVPFPNAEALTRFATGRNAAQDWTAWLSACVLDKEQSGKAALQDWIQAHLATAESLAGGTGQTGTGELWEQNAGRKAREFFAALSAESDASGHLSAWEYMSLVDRLMANETVRDRDAPDSRVMIWGTLEARVQGADLVLLGGLNEATWPEMPAADPWLNRELRHKAGLLVPERQVGLAGHDFQQAVAVPEVWITRARKSDNAETIPSRWLNRLTNLLDGLPGEGGKAALAEMRARGGLWLERARALDAAPKTDSAPRPSPIPPPDARPRRISVTGVRTLIRDPYAIYAKSVLRLRPLAPLVRAPDALLRGIVVHKIFEMFVQESAEGKIPLTAGELMRIAHEALPRYVPWPVARSLWAGRLASVSDWFVGKEVQRRETARPVAFEEPLRLDLKDPDFTLSGIADRIDAAADGSFHLYDYKTGTPPTSKQQRHFEKQLLLEAALLDLGGWAKHPQARTSAATFIGLGPKPAEVPAPREEEPSDQVIEGLKSLFRAYLEDDLGYTSRKAMERATHAGDYDHLARHGEWDDSAPAIPQVLK